MKKQASKTLSPVSVKFYASLSDRVRESLCRIGREDAVAEAMACIDRYLSDGTMPSDSADSAIRLTFALLRAEIDKAVLRSSKARRRAAERTAKMSERVVAAVEPSRVSTAPCASAASSVRAAEADGTEEDGGPQPFVPRNRRERRLYEQEVHRAARRLTRRLAGSVG